MPHVPDRRLLLAASTPLSYAVAAPILRELGRDPRIRILASGRHGGARAAREGLGVPLRYVPRVVAPLLRVDLALCPGFHYRGRAKTTVQTFHGVSPKNYAVRGDVLRFDHLFVIGEYHRSKLVRAALVAEDDRRVHRIGMPKTDPLVGPRDAGRALVLAHGLDPAVPTVGFVPTRSGAAGSSLEAHGPPLLDALARLPWNVLVKLHDRSQRRFRRGLEVDWEREVAARERAPGSRVRLVHGGDVVPVLQAADVLVSDLSSAANEFLLCDRPLVHLEVPRHEAKLEKSMQRRFEGDGEDLGWLRAAGEICSGPAGLAAAIERALAAPAARSELRRERAARLFYNPGCATAAAVRALRRLLELEDRAEERR